MREKNTTDHTNLRRAIDVGREKKIFTPLVTLKLLNLLKLKIIKPKIALPTLMLLKILVKTLRPVGLQRLHLYKTR